MRILIGCEESAKTRTAFEIRGHDAWSCDLAASRIPGNHLKMDIFKAVLLYGPWDIIILHPVCDCLAVSGNGTYAKGKAKYPERIASLHWTSGLWETSKIVASIGVALENPVGVLGSVLGKPTQYIQPWQYGHGETKKTCLWLYGLPKLVPTNIVNGREQRVWKMSPGPDRKRLRGETYSGWSEAMADQWGSLPCNFTNSSKIVLAGG